MKRLPVLLLLSSVALLCSAAPALDTVTCNQEGAAAATQLALQHINKNHHHGYKFRLNKIEGSKVEQVDDGCNVDLQLDLLETTCHVVNSKLFENCPLREEHARQVMANCSVTMTVKTGDAKVTKYDCDTRQVKNNMEMMSICPDCPTLMPLNNTEGLKSVHEAVKKFNGNTTNQHYYILKEVGRISSGYIMMTGMNYYAEFALVETHCPMGSRIVPEACKPLCPDRAHHAFCRSSYSSTNGLGSVECEFYPPLNSTTLGPGEKEPTCRHPSCGGHHYPFHSGERGPPPHAHGPPPHAHGPPPHAHGPPPHAHGPPPHAHGPPPHAHGPPPHAHGPPPHAHGHSKEHSHHNSDHGQNGHGQKHPPNAHGQGPPPGHEQRHHHKPFLRCHGFLANVDPPLHPICPWPSVLCPIPKPSQS